MSISGKEKSSVGKLLAKSKATSIETFHVHQTDAKSADVAIGKLKATIAKGKADYEIILVRK
jgi:hypothetical protein